MDDSEERTGSVTRCEPVTTLDMISPPGSCRVASISAPAMVRKRLLALGFIPGAAIEAVRAAPLGDPVEYRIKGYTISLRKEDARLIAVTPGCA
ncbi:MAG: ferrous iron transport protein A [Methanomicrobiales archaeon]|nr:ferrous iron transport protein A [Methanomicrobiales archaeon]